MTETSRHEGGEIAAKTKSDQLRGLLGSDTGADLGSFMRLLCDVTGVELTESAKITCAKVIAEELNPDTRDQVTDQVMDAYDVFEEHPLAVQLEELASRTVVDATHARRVTMLFLARCAEERIELEASVAE